MIRSNGGKRISQFLVNNEPLSDAKFTYVQDGTNYAISFGELLALFGATIVAGDGIEVTQVGDTVVISLA